MRNTILNYKFSNQISEGDNNEEYNEIHLLVNGNLIATELIDYAEANDFCFPHICMDLMAGTYCLVDETGFNCDRNYSTGNMREIDLDNLGEIDTLLTSYVAECIKDEMEGGW